MILPLVDNFEDDRHHYELHVYTGFSKKAGTKSNINFTVYGSEGDTGERSLSDGVRQVLLRFYQHINRVLCHYPIGNLELKWTFEMKLKTIQPYS